MKNAYGLLALVAFAASAPAVADKDRESDQDAPKEAKLCRTQGVTGSLIAKRRICMTKAEWADLDARNQKGLDDTMRRASGGKMCYPDPNDPFQGCPG